MLKHHEILPDKMGEQKQTIFLCKKCWEFKLFEYKSTHSINTFKKRYIHPVYIMGQLMSLIKDLYEYNPLIRDVWR